MKRDKKRHWYTLVWKFGSSTEAQPELLEVAQSSSNISTIMVYNQYTGRPFARMACTPQEAANSLRIALQVTGMDNIRVSSAGQIS